MLRFVRLALIVGLVAVSVRGAFGCRVFGPSNRPIEACMRTCNKYASKQCNEAQCERGCEFVLDRLVENEGDRIIACIASSPRRCTDVVWADCAVRVGPHADGGPPAPPPPIEED